MTDSDDLVNCPYNSSHRMLRKRLQNHIIKCRLNYPEVELLQCPFNPMHLFDEIGLPGHVRMCPDRNLLLNYKIKNLPTKEEEQPRLTQEVLVSEENWDDEKVSDYEPSKHIETANVLRSGMHMFFPKEKKEFRKSERKRLGDWSDEDKVKEGSSYAISSTRPQGGKYVDDLRKGNSSRLNKPSGVPNKRNYRANNAEHYQRNNSFSNISTRVSDERNYENSYCIKPKQTPCDDESSRNKRFKNDVSVSKDLDVVVSLDNYRGSGIHSDGSNNSMAKNDLAGRKKGHQKYFQN